MHLISPLIYTIFVKIISKIKPCPKNNLMIRLRKIHNLFLLFNDYENIGTKIYDYLALKRKIILINQELKDQY